jgi:threonine/homoserine/homoserine lactone efflux protein
MAAEVVMTHAAELWLFFGIVLGVVALPGLDMAYVVGSALVGGRRAGLAAVGGLMAGALCHLSIGAFGLAVVLAVMPAAFDALLVAGAVYMAWIGISIWKAADGIALGRAEAVRSPGATFARGLLTNLMNPKAYLFMLAVFPQFVRPQDGGLLGQVVPLAAIIVGTQLAVYGSIACAAAAFRDGLAARPRIGHAVARTVAATLVAGAAVTLLQGWR